MKTVIYNIGTLAGILPEGKLKLDGAEMNHVECIENAYLVIEDGIIVEFGKEIPDQVGNDRRSGLISIFERRNDHNPFRSVKTPGNDDIRAFRERSADGLECPASHDDRTARSCALEELQVFGNMPQEGVVPSYGIIVRYRYYDAFFHFQWFWIPRQARDDSETSTG